MIEYEIQPVSPEAHLFRIRLRVPEPDPGGQLFWLPAWIPGSYMIRDFARNLVWVRARTGDLTVPLNKADKQTWRAPPVMGELHLEYEVYAWELSVRAAYLDTTRGYFNGTSVFLAVRGRECDSCRVTISAPRGEAYAEWRLATTLESEQTETFGFGRFRARDYADLIDHPVEMGRFAVGEFRVAGTLHQVAISRPRRVDMERLCGDLQAICAQHAALFGELPVERYLFLLTPVGDGYGGLEHRDCCSILCKRDNLPQPGDTAVGEGYRELLGLCSHEYFHLWNGKRISPRVFHEGGLCREVHTRLLWLFEGATSYFDDLALVRSGRISLQSYLELLARTLTRLWRGSGRTKQTLEESSFDAWTKFYKQDENAPNAIVSYYTKGAVVALALDLLIRSRSAGARSLDHVMRALWQRNGRTGEGVDEWGVEPLIGEVSGLDLSDFLEQALRGTEDLALEELFDRFAVSARRRPSRGVDDRGGIAEGAEPPADVRAQPVLGAKFSSGGSEALLSQVLDGGPAQRAGLSAGDVVIAVDGIRALPDNLERLIARVPPGDKVRVHAFRRDELIELDLYPTPAPADTWDLWPCTDAEPDKSARRDAWLAPLPVLGGEG